MEFVFVLERCVDAVLVQYEFSSRFDSGNLWKVEWDASAPYDFQIWISPDCHGVCEIEICQRRRLTVCYPTHAGTEFENNNRAWFYFGMSTTEESAVEAPEGTVLTFTIRNMNPQFQKQFAKDLRPIYRVVSKVGAPAYVISAVRLKTSLSVFSCATEGRE